LPIQSISILKELTPFCSPRLASNRKGRAFQYLVS
jgi:hypothetical protein